MEAKRYEGPLRTGMLMRHRTNGLVAPYAPAGEHEEDWRLEYWPVRPAPDDAEGWKLFVPDGPLPDVGPLPLAAGEVRAYGHPRTGTRGVFVILDVPANDDGTAHVKWLAGDGTGHFSVEGAIGHSVVIFPAESPAAPVERALAAGWIKYGHPNHATGIGCFCGRPAEFVELNKGDRVHGRCRCLPCAEAAGAFAEPLRGEAVAPAQRIVMKSRQWGKAEAMPSAPALATHVAWCGGKEYPRTSRPVFVRAGVAFCSNECADQAPKVVAKHERPIVGVYSGGTHGDARGRRWQDATVLLANLARERPQSEPVRTKGRFLTARIGGGR